MNPEYARYFENEAHKDISEFFCTSDEQCFKKEEQAKSHALNLSRKKKDDKVERVTREQYNEWKAANPSVPGEPTLAEKIAAAQARLNKATEALNAATKAKEAIAADATAKAKGDATKAVNKATAEVGDAQVALDELQPAE